MRERIAQIHPAALVDCIEEFVDAGNWPAVAGCRAARRCRHRCLRPGAGQDRHGGLGHEEQGHFVTVGAAGGKRLAHEVDIEDLALVTHDPLAGAAALPPAQGAWRSAQGTNIGVACVFSREAVAARSRCGC